uniref:Uncharacterized protein n=1 Tax=Arion vulgaris TaxID=1028688 RepID=A0A0B6ZUE8_9EUPU
MTTGSISYDEFRSLVENFVDRSDKIDDKWHVEYGAHGGGMYMCKRIQVVPAVCRRKSNVGRNQSNSIL